MNHKITDISIGMGDFNFPGNPEITISGPYNRVKGNNPEFVYDIQLCSQSGTHIQGGHYFKLDGKSIDKYDIEDFQGEAYIIDIFKRGEDVTGEELKNKISKIDLDGKVLILRTGHMEELISEKIIDEARRPGISLDAAEYLCEEKKVKMIAIDSIGLESRNTKNYEVNTYLSGRGVLILECISNINNIENGNIILEAYPLKIVGVEGSPCRAVIREIV